MTDIIIRDVTAAQLHSITTALAAGGVDFETTELFFTTDEAALLIEGVSARQRDLLTKVAAWDGVLPASEILGNSDSLRGLTGPITKVVNKLVKEGKIRDGLRSPIETVYDPDIKAFQKARAFKMDSPNVAAFQAAVKG